MRVLIDTNILIYREDDHVLSSNVQELSVGLPKITTEVFVHPLSIQDLKRDLDTRRRDVMLSKIRAYSFLDKPPDPKTDCEYLDSIGIRSEDKCATDDAILYAVFRDAVDFLITEDRGIHRKARRLGIHDRVLTINDTLRFHKRLFSGDGPQIF